jgi:hypothetical protein
MLPEELRSRVRGIGGNCAIGCIRHGAHMTLRVTQNMRTICAVVVVVINDYSKFRTFHREFPCLGPRPPPQDVLTPRLARPLTGPHIHSLHHYTVPERIQNIRYSTTSKHRRNYWQFYFQRFGRFG